MRYDPELYDENYLNLMEQGLYRPDGTVTAEYRKSLKKQGISDAEIANFERLKREEIEDRKLWGPTREEQIARFKNRAIERAGLNTEELLSQGFVNVDELDELF